MTAPLWFRQLLTEDDANSVYDPVRATGAIGVATMVVGALTVAVLHGTFDAMAFGTGIAAIAGAVGVGAGVKAHLGA